MQSVRWYLRRLQTMTPQEMAWRLSSTLRNATDRCLASRRRRTIPIVQIVEPAEGADEARSGVLCPGLLNGAPPVATNVIDRHEDLIAKADRIRDNRLSFFDLEDLRAGEEINWNYEYKAGVSTPLRFASGIDYRDYRVTGDCKVVWEPNRHHHLAVLGRAYRVTGDCGYATAAAGQLESWMRQCPFAMGMNWRSPLELAIRLINWVCAFELIGSSGALTGGLRERLIRCVYHHLWEISRKYSRGSSANNHLIGEAAGVFIGTNYFRNLKDALRWRTESREILCCEIQEQTFPDGGSREQAVGYHLFVLQFFLLSALSARNAGEEMPNEYWARLERMFEYAAALAEGGASLPMFGDCDDGYVLDLGERADVRAAMATGAVLFDRADFKRVAGSFCESAFWLLGNEGRHSFGRIPVDPHDDEIHSRAFPDSGCYLLQRGSRAAGDQISVAFDCGDLGYGSIAAHGHADALSFTLRVSGTDVLVDPGTYDYFTYGRWREYFRSTRAHNSLVVDGVDQSEMMGPFMWGRRAAAHCVRWIPTPDGGTVVGQHDGYTRLADPVTHRRTVTVQNTKPDIVVQDVLMGRGRHQVELYLHLSEQCRIVRREDNCWTFDFGAGVARLALDSRLRVSAVKGNEEPILGWVSRGYHCKTPSITLVGRCVSEGNLLLTTHIEIDGNRTERAADAVEGTKRAGVQVCER